jgi:hypothetical protein
MKLRYLAGSLEEWKILKGRMDKFSEYYCIFPDSVSLIVKQGAVESIVNIYPEDKYSKIKELHPMKKERGGLSLLNVRKSATIQVGNIEYQVHFKSKNLSQ